MKTKRITNRQAFELAAQGDAHAISALLFKYKNVIFKQISSYELFDNEDIEDVQMDVILCIIQALPNFDINRLK